MLSGLDHDTRLNVGKSLRYRPIGAGIDNLYHTRDVLTFGKCHQGNDTLYTESLVVTRDLGRLIQPGVLHVVPLQCHRQVVQGEVLSDLSPKRKQIFTGNVKSCFQEEMSSIKNN